MNRNLGEYWNERAKSLGLDKAVGFCGPKTKLYKRLHYHIYKRDVLPLIHDRSAVFEVGCGWGRWARFLHQRFGPQCELSYQGIDISEEMVRKARSAGLPSRYAFSHVEGKGFEPAGDRDVVYSFTVLQHMRFEDQEVTLERMKAQVKPGGRLVLVEAIDRPGVKYSDHMFPRVREEWESLVRKGGFSLERVTARGFVEALQIKNPGSKLAVGINRLTGMLHFLLFPVIEGLASRNGDPRHATHLTLIARKDG